MKDCRHEHAGEKAYENLALSKARTPSIRMLKGRGQGTLRV